MGEGINQPWLQQAELQELLGLLNADGAEARIAGGAVRNALLDQPINDIDIATTLVPRDVILCLRDAGHKSVPTGIEHGTITAIVGDHAFEVTTLRKDVETNGRHAKVLYGTDWAEDARRRDLTMNALYLDADGTVFDPLGGFEDVMNQNVRFIDDAEMRIREDYLRILRFFRFFAWYGKFRPDADGLRASAKLKAGLAGLSVERIWQELSKLFAAADPARAILWMRQTGVLSAVLPESDKWGIDALPGLIEVEYEQQWDPDNMMRLMAILPPDSEKMKALSNRLKLPNKVSDRLTAWANTALPAADTKQAEFEKYLYRQNAQAVQDQLRLAVAKRNDGQKKFLRMLKWHKRWQRPDFPVRGQDLLDSGMEPGPQVSNQLSILEDCWVESGFKLSKTDLLKLNP